MKLGTEKPFMAVLRLAAARGRYFPAKEWVRKDMEWVQQETAFIEDLTALAFFACFVADPAEHQLPVRLAGVEEARGKLDLLRSKRESAGGWSLAFVHPFFARLYLVGLGGAEGWLGGMEPPQLRPDLRNVVDVWANVLATVRKRVPLDRLERLVRMVLFDKGTERLSLLGEWCVRNDVPQAFAALAAHPESDTAGALPRVDALLAESRVWRYASRSTMQADKRGWCAKAVNCAHEAQQLGEAHLRPDVWSNLVTALRSQGEVLLGLGLIDEADSAACEADTVLQVLGHDNAATASEVDKVSKLGAAIQAARDGENAQDVARRLPEEGDSRVRFPW
jgi:hypothetical protein